MGKVTQKVPSTQAVNNRLIATGEASLKRLDDAQKKIEHRRLDPAYQHPENAKKLDALSAKLADQKAVLAEEMAARSELRTALANGQKEAEKTAQNKLKALRKDHAKAYGKTMTVTVCQPCIDKKLASMRTVRTPGSPEAMSDLITGVFEGREPDYCAIADSPTDAGGLSYGKHQAAEKKGGLHKMLSAYVNCSDPVPDATNQAKIKAHLAKFSADKKKYQGTLADRAAFKAAMKSACSDPAMRTTQDDFFAANYMKPALESAKELCVSSNLGKAMLYDLSIQIGPGRIDTLAPKAMKRLGKSEDAICSPCDPEGPTESEFLRALNDERRDYVTGLGGDAAKSTYREDFFDDMLDDGNVKLNQDFVVRGMPVRGLPMASDLAPGILP